MDFKLCECGCNLKLSNPNNRFINGHNSSVRKLTKDHKDNISKSLQNRKFSDETLLKMSASALGKRNTEQQNINISKSLKSLNLKLTNDQKIFLSNFHSGQKQTNETKKKISDSLSGRPLSTEHKLKIGLSRKGKKHTIGSRIKISQSRKGIKISQESKIKMSISHIKYLENTVFNGHMYPSVGKNETFILDILEKNINYTIVRNDRTIADITGKFPDGYIKELNLVIEIDEPHHYVLNDQLRAIDQQRQDILISKMNCQIYRIREQNFLDNQEIEINNFLNFINSMKVEI